MPEEAAEKMKLVEGKDFYWEGAAVVFSERYHLRRGSCCGNGCRHCPYAPKHREGATDLRPVAAPPGGEVWPAGRESVE
jgi:hypothetical protein